MKKIVSLILTGVIFFASLYLVYGEYSSSKEKELSVDSNNIEGFNDIYNHWAKDYITNLIAIGSINGYPNGNFMPDNTIKVGEFTKILVTSLGYEDLGNFEGGHWSLNYIEKAKELELIRNSEFTDEDLDREINRGEMARMIARAINEEYPEELNQYKPLINDYESIPVEYQENVLKAFVKGIITGYEDGKFKFERKATRAEASTMIVRMLDKDERKEPIINEEVDKEETEIVINGETIISENPENVIPIAIKAREIMKEGKGLFYEQYNGKGMGDILFWYYLDPNVNVDDFDQRYTMDFTFEIYTELRSEGGAKYPYEISLMNLSIGEESYNFTKEILQTLFPNKYDKAYQIIVDAMKSKKSNKEFELRDKKYYLDDRILRLYTIKNMEGLSISVSVKNLEE